MNRIKCTYSSTALNYMKIINIYICNIQALYRYKVNSLHIDQYVAIPVIGQDSYFHAKLYVQFIIDN